MRRGMLGDDCRRLWNVVSRPLIANIKHRRHGRCYRVWRIMRHVGQDGESRVGALHGDQL
jgi:hypothetical protein